MRRESGVVNKDIDEDVDEEEEEVGEEEEEEAVGMIRVASTRIP